jgi:hypothetical protein
MMHSMHLCLAIWLIISAFLFSLSHRCIYRLIHLSFLLTLFNLVSSCLDNMSFKTSFSAYTNDQNQQLFVLALNIVTTKAKDERKVTLKKMKLKKQLLRKKSKTRINALTSNNILTASSSKILSLNSTNENDSDEIFSEMISHHTRFIDLSSKEIVRIFNEKFKLINFYKLRYMRELNHEFYLKQNHIELEKNEQLKNLRKIVRIFKNFDKFYYEMYSETFINYHLIVMSLSDKISSNLFVTLIKFQ